MTALEKNCDIIQVEGINSKGYGTFPKMVLEDERLTSTAVSIYAAFAAYAGAGKTAFPKVTTIMQRLDLSKDTYYKHFNLLKKYGYIKVTQERRNGRYIRNLYSLPSDIETPVPEKPDTAKQNADTVKARNSASLQTEQSVAPFRNLSDTILPDTVNQDTAISKSNIFKNKQYFDNYHVQSSQSYDGHDNDVADDIAQKIEAYYDLIKENIGYNDLAVSKPYSLRLVDEMIAIIIDVLITEDKIVRINGENKPRELVKHNLLRLTYEDIEHAIDQFKSQTSQIKNKRQYILTMLYNCKLELGSHYTNLVKHDMWN